MSRVAASCGEAAMAEGNSMPYDHQSMPTSCPPPRATSGATYSCVPTNELDCATRFSATAWPSFMAYSHEDDEPTHSPSSDVPDADVVDEGEVPRAERR
uniref:Uncharacterized protein n=1 Tax=Oryza barthii TaxID=65489 RepID=A0A0D3HC57_9ORYZ